MTSLLAPSLAPALVDVPLTLDTMHGLAGELAGQTFVKVVYDREQGALHALDHARCEFHVNHVGWLLGLDETEIDARLDSLNHELYQAPGRRFLAGIIAVHRRADAPVGEEPVFCSLETTEVDGMGADLLVEFHDAVRARLDPALSLLLKPAHHAQETLVAAIDAERLPRIMAHELYSTAPFVPLNPGTTQGRLRVFADEQSYRAEIDSLEWYDILVMPRVPDDVPRLAGLINTEHTTPLSHTNVLAAGWGIPNAIQIGGLDRIAAAGLAGSWVRYGVAAGADEIELTAVSAAVQAGTPPPWTATRVPMDIPVTTTGTVRSLASLRAVDRCAYGTKAANLGELHHILAGGSPRLAGFYEIARPPRPNLLEKLPALIGVPNLDGTPAQAAARFLAEQVRLPRGVAIPFAMHQAFLASSPAIQQTIGKLKMALELGAREVDALCVGLQNLIRSTPIPTDLRAEIDDAIARNLGGVATFVIRSSSNAEDLAGFSAAGIYESVNHVSTTSHVFDSVREVWASLVSPRSVRLRQQASISLDDAYMGVIVQEQVPADLGGVLVTTNPVKPGDFRNVFLNVSTVSTEDVVSGRGRPMQYLFNTVEGGGRTISLGDAPADLDAGTLAALARLSVVGRLLQAHFAPDYTYSAPVDIEWVLHGGVLTLLQLRPYSA